MGLPLSFLADFAALMAFAIFLVFFFILFSICLSVRGSRVGGLSFGSTPFCPWKALLILYFALALMSSPLTMAVRPFLSIDARMPLDFIPTRMLSSFIFSRVFASWFLTLKILAMTLVFF